MKLLIFDCDSTLSAIEGIDELGRRGGPAVFADVERMTNDAMNGKISVESVFGARLEIIRPRFSDLEQIGHGYIQTVEPTAAATLAAARAKGWTPMILSGGFRGAIRPLADFLGIERLEAVDLFFDDGGEYCGFDTEYPTTRSGGKPELIQRLREELAPERVIMVGDGASDLETAPVVDLFIGFGRYVARERVKRESPVFIHSLDEVLPYL